MKQTMNDEVERSEFQIGDRVRYALDGKPGSRPALDGIGRIESWNGGPVGYRVCLILPDGKEGAERDARVMRLENEIAHA